MRCGLATPAVGGDQVGVVLHGRGPVVHQVLVDVVGVEQRHLAEAVEQRLGNLLDQRLGLAAALKGDELRRCLPSPVGKAAQRAPAKGVELLVIENDRFDLGQRPLEAGVARSVGARKEGVRARRAAHPSRRQSASRSRWGMPRAQVAVDVLHVLGLAAVDVARQVEVEVVLVVGNLVQRHQARIARHVGQPRKGVDNAVDVLLAQAILVAVLDKAPGGVASGKRPLRAAAFSLSSTTMQAGMPVP